MSESGPIMDSVLIDSSETILSPPMFPAVGTIAGDREVGAATSLPPFKIIIDLSNISQDLLSPYTTYHVITQVGEEKKGGVWRRYSDFLWIYEKLRTSNQSILVPVLPEKDFLGKNDNRVVEYRMRELQRFLNRVASHRALKDDLNFKIFLEGSDQEFNMAKLQVSPDPPSNKSSGSPSTASSGALSSWFSFLKPTTASSSIDKDTWFVLKEQSLSNIDTALAGARKSSYFVILKTRELADSYSDLCVQFAYMKEAELQESEELALSLAKFADLSKSISLQFNDLAEQNKQDLEDSLSDYHRMIKAMRELLKYRTELITDYDTANSTLASKRVRGEDCHQIEEEVRKKEQLFQTSSQTIRKEIEEYEKTKTKELKQCIARVVHSNLVNFQKILGEWEKVHQELTHERDE